MDIDVTWLAAFCGSFPTEGGLIGGLFIAGAIGSAMHCGPMCGVFVLGQVSDRLARVPAQRLCEWRRLQGGLLLPYHLGRLTTYAALGAFAGASGGLLPRISPVLLTAAALLFLAYSAGWALPQAPPGWAGLLRRVITRLPRGGGISLFATGLALGYLPCGFLYGALLAATAAGGAVLGAEAMLAFGLGTVPVLALIGVAGHMAGRRWNGAVRRIAPVVMAANGLLLLILAWRTIA